MAKPCGHVEIDSSCRICELASTRADYAKLWGEPTADLPPVPVTPDCISLGREFTGAERAERKLSHGPVWRQCFHPMKPLGTDAVCQCQGCGVRCPGYVADEDNMTEESYPPEVYALAHRLATEPPAPLGIGKEVEFVERSRRIKELTAAHIVLLREALNSPPPVTVGTGHGIVQAVGGTMYFSCAYAGVKALRHVGCKLPIEWWHLGPAELDPQMVELVKPLGVVCVDALKVAERVGKPRILNGWELKAFAVAHCGFREFLFLDADNVVTKDPTYLFDDPNYVKHGAAFWPDLPPNDRTEWMPAVVWHNVGLEPRNEPDFESGQFMADKSRCAKELGVTVHINSYSDWYYGFVFGDKSTFHLAWRVCGSDYAMPSTPAGWTWAARAILQHDFDGHLLFQHVCQGKDRLAAGTMSDGLVLAESVNNGARELRNRWNGQIWSAAHEDADGKELAAFLAGLWYYRREVDGTGRPIELKPGGSIGVGAASCEQRWTARVINGVPTLVVSGAAHKGTVIGMMFLTESPDGKWRGRWEAHERCAVTMAKMPEVPDVGWARESPDRVESDGRAGTKVSYVSPGVVRCRVLGRFDVFCRTDDYTVTPHMEINGFWERWVTTVIARLVEPGMVCVDVGANCGYFSVLMAHAAGSAGEVISIEPQPELANLLRRTADANGFKHMRVEECAVGAEAGTAVLRTPPGQLANASISIDYQGAGTVEVKVRPLADIIGQRSGVDVIKIDAEGGEDKIWSGMRTTLLDYRPIIVMEYNPTRTKYADGFLRELKDYGEIGIIRDNADVIQATEEELTSGAEHMLVIRPGSR